MEKKQKVLDLLKVLITCNHVLNNLKIGNEIKLIFDDRVSKIIKLDESRKLYTNEENDITIIELKENEFDINDYLKIDNNIYNEINKKIKKYILFIMKKEKN